MPIQDRTKEFRACVESIRNRSTVRPRGPESKQPLLANGKTSNKSDFSRMASAIGKDIGSTTIKLGKLAQRMSCLVLLQTMLTCVQLQNEKPCLTIGQSKLACVSLVILSGDMDLTFRFQELTFVIKQDIASINKQIAALQTFIKQRNAQGSKSPEGKQIDEHNHNVVMLLQSKLATTSMTFKDVLEVRTQVNKSMLLFPSPLKHEIRI
jgi:syntaxin 5